MGQPQRQQIAWIRRELCNHICYDPDLRRRCPGILLHIQKVGEDRVPP